MSKRPTAIPPVFEPLGDDELDRLNRFLLELDQDAWREGCLQ